ncbi:hypothetical protein L228DRAFT_242264 [Xylona heveae TC161]|uniref:Uncharacterized protein n=1 Tax=Xylona heveae (strain CBS 132557 / TC161) TaxID=1328760 RepID=A0A165J899_XYLHT|nr:hypothetical protein L228DRAFT_242264 [Xylona heveae TC161]KZF25882.1 hypothetical protein L228DRAFT_242264 [Xylona heveae TC161]
MCLSGPESALLIGLTPFERRSNYRRVVVTGGGRTLWGFVYINMYAALIWHF